MTHPLMPDVIAVEVPGDIDKIGVHLNQLHFRIRHDDEHIVVNRKQRRVLPPGKWAYLFCTADASEEQAAQIVESGKDWFGLNGFMDYATKHISFDTAKESLQSLLSSKGLKQNYALLKKII